MENRIPRTSAVLPAVWPARKTLPSSEPLAEASLPTTAVSARAIGDRLSSRSSTSVRQSAKRLLFIRRTPFIVLVISL